MPIAKLSNRQLQVLSVLENGIELTTAQIANKLHLSITGTEQLLQSLEKIRKIAQTGGKNTEQTWAQVETVRDKSDPSNPPFPRSA